MCSEVMIVYQRNRSSFFMLNNISLVYKQRLNLTLRCFLLKYDLLNMHFVRCIFENLITVSLSVCLSRCQVSVWTNSWRSLVVLHSDHHLLLHGKPGRFPHRGEDGVTYRECRRSRQADRNRIRNPRFRFH